MMTVLDPLPGGTPLADEYRAIVAACARTSTDFGSFDASVYDPSSVREASARWRKRMVDEYGSTTVFSALTAQLHEANATLDATAVTLRMAEDELRHAEVCGRVVRAMGGDPRTRRDATVRPLAIHPGCSPEARALRNVIVTSVSEMYSVAFFVATLERMTDPYLCAVTRHLLADEVLHGRFGFFYLDAWSDWLMRRPDERARIATYLRYVFAVCEREFVREANDRPKGADDEALGLLTSAAARDVFLATMEQAVAPGLDRYGLDATLAWSTRSLS
jgi:hypothetical protein